MAKTTKSLGEQMRESRKRQDKTQGQIADELGISQVAIANWENDKAKPRLDRLHDVARVYKLDFDDLLHEIAA